MLKPVRPTPGPFVVGSVITCTATLMMERTVVAAAKLLQPSTTPYPLWILSHSAPATAYTNDTITVSASVFDDDSSQSVSASYAWHVVDAATGGHRGAIWFGHHLSEHSSSTKMIRSMLWSPQMTVWPMVPPPHRPHLPSPTPILCWPPSHSATAET